VDGLHEPDTHGSERELRPPRRIGARRELSLRRIAPHRDEERSLERASLVQHEDAERCSGSERCWIDLRNDLQGEPEGMNRRRSQWIIGGPLTRPGSEQRLGAAGVELSSGSLAAVRSPPRLDDRLEPLLPEIRFKLPGGQRQRAPTSSVPDDVRSRDRNRDGPGRVPPVDAGDIDHAGGTGQDEPLDLPAVARYGIAPEMLPDPQPHTNRRARPRAEFARLDPEVMSEGGGS
jgi:hypothetical protein